MLLLGAMCAGLIIAAAPARAQTFENDDDYTALCVPLTVDNASPAPGDTVNVSGTAATGGAEIVFFFNGVQTTTDPATVTSDPADHSFSAKVTIPADAPAGPGSIQAFQVGDNTDPFVGCPASVAGLEIVAPPTTATEPLVRTGAGSTLPLTRLGFGLVAAGGLVLLVSRRRKAIVEA